MAINSNTQLLQHGFIITNNAGPLDITDVVSGEGDKNSIIDLFKSINFIGTKLVYDDTNKQFQVITISR